jgi:hypothetical protein
MKIASKKKAEEDYKIISRGPHWTYGFLRKRDDDIPNGYAYEQPDGDVVISMNEYHRNMMMLECREDLHGERYVCICPDKSFIIAYMARMDNFALRVFIRHHDT